MDAYKNPLIERYASEAMAYVFSDDYRFTTWRKLWIALAETQQSLGVSIMHEQIAQMKQQVNNIDYAAAAAYEKKFRHDVMAHIHAFGDVAPLAKPIIHLGATSAFVVDNTDLIQIKEGLQLLKKYVVNILDNLRSFMQEYKSLPTLGFTHFQSAQLTTVGKRATLWAHSLVLDLEDIDVMLATLKLRGAKGTTGTAASFKDIFNHDFDKVKALDKGIAEKMGFSDTYPVTGQTYDRKVDSRILSVLSQIAQSSHKMTNDIRLLAGLKEIEEPFEREQIGSSAMAYKRNPMRSERVASLAKFVMSLAQSANMVAATQWFERTLDDSANKRLSLPQAFLATDAILVLLYDITKGLVVYPNSIRKRIDEELPFMLTEHILMKSVEQGGDRQIIHEVIRKHSLEAAKQVKQEGKPNDLLSRLAKDDSIPFDMPSLEKLCNPSLFIGFAKEQTEDFIHHVLAPIHQRNTHLIGMNYELKV